MEDEIQDIAVDRIFLCEENPRHERLETQEDIVAYLCRDEQVFALAESICTDGTNPLELVGVVAKSDGGKKMPKETYEVWEGNRRICAIQLLNDPERAPSQQRAQFKRLAQNYQPIEHIRACVFTDIDRLKFWMANIHGGEQKGVGRRNWKSEAKARADGTSNRHALALCLLDQAEKFKFIAAEQRKGKLTTLDRYVRNRKVKDALGINDNDLQAIKTDLTDDDFKAILKVIIDDLINNKITSRHNSDKINPYARKLANIAKGSERVESRIISDIEGRSGASRRRRTGSKQKSSGQQTKIEPSEKLQDALRKCGNNKLNDFYDSLCGVSAGIHTQLIAVGCWSFIETLTACAGRKPKVNFISFYSNECLLKYGFDVRRDVPAMRLCLRNLSEVGNITKHHPTATMLNARQLINDMEVLTPLLIATLTKIEASKR